MSQGELIYSIDQRVIGAGAVALFLVAFEVGFRLGRTRSGIIGDLSRAQFATLQAAILGLLALLLGFTFSMADARFNFRRELLLDESTALGTTWLRSSLLPEPHRTTVAGLLRRYLDARIAFYATPDITFSGEAARTASAPTEHLQRELWAEADAAAREDRRAVPTALFLQSLNQVIDLQEKRLFSLEEHVPEAVIVTLGFVSAVALSLLGLGCGLAGRRQLGAAVLATMAIVGVMLLILDLDRPLSGHIHVDQRTMLRLRDTMARGVPVR
jgi:hypothetical protein